MGGTWLAAILAGWLAGVALQLLERTLCVLPVYVAGTGSASVAFGVALVLALRWPRSRWLAASLAAAGAVLAGFAITGWQASVRLADALDPVLEGRDLVVTGVVASLPQKGPGGIRFRFDLDDASRSADGARLPQSIALGWYAGFHEDAALTKPQRVLAAGQHWQFTVRLRRPHGNLNPNGFDSELQLFELGLRATGYVRDAPPPALLGDGNGFPVERLRQRVRDAIDAHVDDRRTAGVLAALTVGDQNAIEHDDWDLFRNTGVAHLMSISGLHVTMFAWLAGLLVAAAWRRSARAVLACPAQIAARWGGLAGACGYAVFSGWGVPSQRTVWMLATVTVLQALGVRWPWLLVLAASAVVVTAIDPWALTQAGFWLSFMAVALLMSSSPSSGDAHETATPPKPGWRGLPARLLAHLRADLRTQVIATLGLTPLTLVFFQQVSIVGFLANLVAIPAVTLVITPLAMLGIAVPPLWWLGSLVVQALDAMLGFLAVIPGAVWVVPAAPHWAQLAGLFAAALIVMPIPWRLRWLGLPLAIALLVPPRTLPPLGQFDLVAADVGQGMAVLVRTRGHVLLFDTGPQYARDSDAGQRVLVPLLRSRGDAHVDLLILSHSDLDHVGGARAVLASLDVDALSSSLDPANPIVALARASGHCTAGQRWTWDGVDFVLLRPGADDYERKQKTNAMSCVLRISGGGRSAILAGDIEKEQEALLVAGQGAALRSDVLVAPHHGSRTSSSAAFLDAVHPRIGVFQAGYRNRFHHPAPDVVDRYRARGATIVASPSCGAWQWLADGPPDGVCERDVARRYWQHAEAPAAD